MGGRTERDGAWKGAERWRGLCSQFYPVFQLQVSSLLSNVFKLLMTHKVRPPVEPSPRALVRLVGRGLGKRAGGRRALRGTSPTGHLSYANIFHTSPFV